MHTSSQSWSYICLSGRLSYLPSFPVLTGWNTKSVAFPSHTTGGWTSLWAFQKDKPWSLSICIWKNPQLNRLMLLHYCSLSACLSGQCQSQYSTVSFCLEKQNWKQTSKEEVIIFVTLSLLPSFHLFRHSHEQKSKRIISTIYLGFCIRQKSFLFIIGKKLLGTEFGFIFFPLLVNCL